MIVTKYLLGYKMTVLPRNKINMIAFFHREKQAIKGAFF